VNHDDPILRNFILFVQTAHAVLKYADAYFYRRAGLSAIKYMVLRIMAANSGTMTPSQLAKWTLRERHNITTLVARLKRDGLVRTERDSTDKRFIRIRLTDKGQRILSQATPVAREIVGHVMLSIDESDAVTLGELLESLRQNAHYGLDL